MNSKNEVSEVNDFPNVRPLSIKLNTIKKQPKVNHIIAKYLLLLLFFTLIIPLILSSYLLPVHRSLGVDGCTFYPS